MAYDGAARDRYVASFQSTIFDPLPNPGPTFVPAGKRRDQTTSELFGSDDHKDLRGMPKTFVPKEEPLTAWQKKQHFLSSDVMYSTPRASAGPPPPMQDAQPRGTGGYAPEDDPAVDANMRRQLELQSKLFGRASPRVDEQQLRDRSTRLTPNDFNWHSHPENVTGVQEMTHDNRAYQEKCSGIFNYSSPQTLESHLRARDEHRQQEADGDAKRRANAHFSDLFGRGAEPGPAAAGAEEPQRRARQRISDEDKIVVHQDWTDARTELLSRASRPEDPAQRTNHELHQARIFGPGGNGQWEAPEAATPVTHDNSQKVKSAFGKSNQEIHQAHLRSSQASEDFYRSAHESTQWEVVELHISGLGAHADDEYVRNLCSGHELQLVKVQADVDPVRNLCKGRARVMLRYNPRRDSIRSLLSKLEDRKLRVEM